MTADLLRLIAHTTSLAGEERVLDQNKQSDSSVKTPNDPISGEEEKSHMSTKKQVIYKRQTMRNKARK